MSPFSNYLQLGYEHIVSFAAMDHILFLVVLMAVFQSRHWLRLIGAVTSFTLGHSITLSLGALEVIRVDAALIEFLIPLTILLTALNNLSKKGQQTSGRRIYWIAGVFGLIHGLGFSNYYRMLVMGEEGYWRALIPFNLGVELGQLLVVSVVLLFMVIYEVAFNRKSRDWNIFFSGAGFGLSTVMCLETWPF